MPFKSKAQQREMFANQPDVAKEWAKETPDMKGLPEHVKKHENKSPKKEKIMQRHPSGDEYRG